MAMPRMTHRRASVPRATVLLLVGGALGVAAAPATAQEFGLDLSAGTANPEHFEAPRGVGARMALYPLRYLGLELGFTHVWSRSRFAGRTCPLSPSEPCGDEEVESRTRVGSASVTALAVIPLGAYRVRVGAGVSQSTVWSAKLRGLETGRTNNAYFGRETLVDGVRNPNGRQLVVSVDRAVQLVRPLRLRVAYERRTVTWEHCWLGRPGGGCGDTDWRQVVIGVSYEGGGRADGRHR